MEKIGLDQLPLLDLDGKQVKVQDHLTITCS